MTGRTTIIMMPNVSRSNAASRTPTGPSGCKIPLWQPAKIKQPARLALTRRNFLLNPSEFSAIGGFNALWALYVRRYRYRRLGSCQCFGHRFFLSLGMIKIAIGRLNQSTYSSGERPDSEITHGTMVYRNAAGDNFNGKPVRSGSNFRSILVGRSYRQRVVRRA